jgi:hypothetical protein
VTVVEPAVRFHSKIDLWLVAVLVTGIVLQSYALFLVLRGDGPVSAKYVVSVSSVLLVSLIASILLRTHYTIAGDQLHIVCGPLYRNIRISGITRVTETRNPLSSPALSLDRLRIEYCNDRSVMVSPDDKPAFLAVIRQQISCSQDK